MLKAKNPLNAKKRLTAKKSLRSSSKLNSRPKRQKPGKLKPMGKLMKEADLWFSRAIRLRDSEFVDGAFRGCCTSCGRWHSVWVGGKYQKGVNAGHFVSRGHYVVRYDKKNVNLQCVYCNKWLSGNITNYGVGLDNKYGVGTAAALTKLAVEQREYKLTRELLNQVVTESKAAIDRYLAMC